MKKLKTAFRFWETRRFRIISLAVLVIGHFCIFLYGYSLLDRLSLSPEWFENHITGAHPEIDLPIVLNELYERATGQAGLTVLVFFLLCMCAFLFAQLIVEIASDPVGEKTRLLGRIEALEKEVAELKKDKE